MFDKFKFTPVRSFLLKYILLMQLKLFRPQFPPVGIWRCTVSSFKKAVKVSLAGEPCLIHDVF